LVSGLESRRRDRRFDFTEDVECRFMSTELEVYSKYHITVKTTNISKGGLCMQMPYKVDEGEIIRVAMPFKGKDSNRPVKVFCEVCWCTGNDEGEFYNAGLRFVALNEDDRGILYSYIEELPNKVN